jgi:polyketide biosynthesis enoyl-CoA hydratase PksH
MELTAPSVDVRLPESLSQDSLAVLAADLEQAFASPAPVVCLRGATDEVFCTGLSLETEAVGPVDVEAFATLLGTLVDAPKPTVAVIDGATLGGGLGLAAACDWVMASKRSTFGLPELLWGLLPAIIWPVVASRMSTRPAMAWVLHAQSRPAEAALAAGLVDELTGERPDHDVRRRVRALRRLDSGALADLRRWARDSARLPVAAAMAQGAAITAARLQSPAVRARLDAFNRGEAPWES